MYNKQYNGDYTSRQRLHLTAPTSCNNLVNYLFAERIAWIAVAADSINQLFRMSNVKAGANDPTAQDKEQSVKDVRLLIDELSTCSCPERKWFLLARISLA